LCDFPFVIITGVIHYCSIYKPVKNHVTTVCPVLRCLKCH